MYSWGGGGVLWSSCRYAASAWSATPHRSHDDLGSDHLTSGGGGGGFEKNILALIFVKQNILASTQKKKIV